MSRSWKKTPGYLDRNPYNKNQANRKVRHTWDVPDGGSYKKIFESYNICDYACPFYTDYEHAEYLHRMAAYGRDFAEEFHRDYAK